MALLGARSATVVDVSPANEKFGSELARALGVDVRYVVCAHASPCSSVPLLSSVPCLPLLLRTTPLVSALPPPAPPYHSSRQCPASPCSSVPLLSSVPCLPLLLRTTPLVSALPPPAPPYHSSRQCPASPCSSVPLLSSVPSYSNRTYSRIF
jgi:hypothetical protein